MIQFVDFLSGFLSLLLTVSIDDEPLFETCMCRAAEESLNFNILLLKTEET